MARQPRTFTTKSGRTDSAHALKNLERVVSVGHRSVRVAQAAAHIALAREYRWQPDAPKSLSNDDHPSGAKSLFKQRTKERGSESGLGGESDGRGRARISAESGWSRTAAKVDVGARLQRQMLDLSRAVNALSRAERSTESGSIERSISDGQKVAALMLPPNNNLTGRARGSLEGSRMSPGAAAVAANFRIASSLRGVIAPGNVSRRDFAQPSSNGRFSNDGGERAGITINSSPTVVINAPTGGALQQDVIGALRAHREELFDQLKRESARRERAQF
jgi:hypothetical protein